MLAKKAKVVTIFLNLFFAWNALYADVKIPEKALIEKIDIEPDEDELIMLDRMIFLTQNLQQAQVELKKIIVELRLNEEKFLKGDQCKLYAHYMIRGAKEALSIIRTYHLEHLFPSRFIEELAIYTKIGTKEVLQ